MGDDTKISSGLQKVGGVLGGSRIIEGLEAESSGSRRNKLLESFTIWNGRERMLPPREAKSAAAAEILNDKEREKLLVTWEKKYSREVGDGLKRASLGEIARRDEIVREIGDALGLSKNQLSEVHLHTGHDTKSSAFVTDAEGNRFVEGVLNTNAANGQSVGISFRLKYPFDKNEIVEVDGVCRRPEEVPTLIEEINSFQMDYAVKTQRPHGYGTSAAPTGTMALIKTSLDAAGAAPTPRQMSLFLSDAVRHAGMVAEIPLRSANPDFQTATEVLKDVYAKGAAMVRYNPVPYMASENLISLERIGRALGKDNSVELREPAQVVATDLMAQLKRSFDDPDQNEFRPDRIEKLKTLLDRYDLPELRRELALLEIRAGAKEIPRDSQI